MSIISTDVESNTSLVLYTLMKESIYLLFKLTDIYALKG